MQKTRYLTLLLVLLALTGCEKDDCKNTAPPTNPATDRILQIGKVCKNDPNQIYMPKDVYNEYVENIKKYENDYKRNARNVLNQYEDNFNRKINEANHQVEALNLRLEQKEAEILNLNQRQAYLEQQASIAKGCGFLIPVCTASMTAEGKEAIKQGYGGLDSLHLWLFATTKIIMLLALGWASMVGIRRFRNNSANNVIRQQLQQEKLDLEQEKQKIQQQLDQATEKNSQAANRLKDVELSRDKIVEQVQKGRDLVVQLAEERKRLEEEYSKQQQKNNLLKEEIADRERLKKLLDDSMDGI